MEIEKAKLVIAHFLDIDPSQIDQHTLMDHTVIKSSLLLHRMFAALAKEGYLLEDPASIETFGDFEQAISEEIDSPPSIQNSEKEKETHHSNKKEAQSIFKKEIGKEENKNFKLRIAVMKKEGSNFQYALGFDDNITSNDKVLNINELEIIISNISFEMCDGMTIDYVELEKNQFNFIFLNPKDPNYVEPKE